MSPSTINFHVFIVHHYFFILRYREARANRPDLYEDPIGLQKLQLLQLFINVHRSLIFFTLKIMPRSPSILSLLINYRNLAYGKTDIYPMKLVILYHNCAIKFTVTIMMMRKMTIVALSLYTSHQCKVIANDDHDTMTTGKDQKC